MCHSSPRFEPSASDGPRGATSASAGWRSSADATATAPCFREHARLWGSLRCCDCPVVVCRAEPRIAPAEGVFERVVQHGGAHVEEGLHSRPVPAHLLLFVHAFSHDLIDRTCHEGRRDRLAASTPGGVGNQCAFVALEVAQQLTDVPLKTPDAGYVAHLLALRRATQGCELAPPSRPAAVPQAPLRTLQSATRLCGQVR